MKKVLIVDDTIFMRVALRRLLESKGFEVVGEADNGETGVAKYKELQPDIVTMDITMPKKTGLEALVEIMNIDHNAKVIMVSAMGQESMVKEAIINGAKSFIVKPFNEDYVIETLNKIASL